MKDVEHDGFLRGSFCVGQNTERYWKCVLCFQFFLFLIDRLFCNCFIFFPDLFPEFSGFFVKNIAAGLREGGAAERRLFSTSAMEASKALLITSILCCLTKPRCFWHVLNLTLIFFLNSEIWYFTQVLLLNLAGKHLNLGSSSWL